MITRGRGWCLTAGFLGLASALAASPSRADPAVVAVRTGDHPGFGRIVFEANSALHYEVARDGDRVVLHFAGEPAVGGARAPRNVTRFSGGAGEAELILTPGARLRPTRIGERVVIDVLDPAAPVSVAVGLGVSADLPAAPVENEPKLSHRLPIPPIPPEIIPALALPLPVAVQQVDPYRTALPETKPVVTAAALPAATPQPQISTAPEPVVQKQGALDTIMAVAATAPAELNAGPVTLAAALLPLPPGRSGAAFSVPFGVGVGAAALRRGDEAIIVFDERRPVDLAGVAGDKLLAAASIQMLPAATMIRLPVPVGMEFSLSRTASGNWAILLAAPAARQEAAQRIPVRPEKGRVLLAVAPAGNVVSVADPETGAVLLLGTLRQSGLGMPVGRRAAQFALLPSWQGIAVLPMTDRLMVRSGEAGFSIIAEGEAGQETMLSLATGSGVAVNAAVLTRRFDFPAARNEELLRRMQAQLSNAAAAPPLARGPKRVAAAQTALALGLGTEAQSMLAIAAQEDPGVADSPEAAGLSAIAALMAGRMDASEGIEDPRLTGTDEVALWRAVRAARLQAGSPEAAAIFAATLPLMLAYPAALRDGLLPLALETMALGGEAELVRPILNERQDDPALRIAAGLQKRATGDNDGALMAFDMARAGNDRRDRARAAVLAVELRLATHKIQPKEAAARLDAGLYAWRGDGLEFDTRLRLAGLKAEAGEWRAALALLRETEAVFPERRPEIRARLQKTFEAALEEGPGRENGLLDLVTLVEENADLLAQGSPSADLQARLADRLVALELPRRAGPLLEKLVQNTPPGAVRAGFGSTLARLRLQEGDPDAAIAAMFASSAEDLPAAVSEQRRLLFATATSRKGDGASALAAIASLDTPAADEVRATLYEQAKNWPAAAAALAAYLGRTPAMGETPDEMRARTLVRLATAASQAGDETILASLRGNALAQNGKGPLSDLFRLLTADPVTKPADLKRARQEIASAKALPAGLKALERRPAVP